MKDEFETNDNPLDTGVEGLNADDMYQNTPVFDVSNTEFFGNMRKDRRKMDFTASEKPNQFINGTQVRKPFYMRFTDQNNGKTYLNKVK